MNKPIVEITDLCFSYSGKEVLHSIDLTIYEKDFVAVIGPNGGGKTTLLKLVLGLLKPTRGRIKIRNKPPRSNDTTVGYVPQQIDHNLSFPATALDIVLMGTHNPDRRRFFGDSKGDRRDAFTALEKMGIGEYADRKITDLSGGQRQRVLIARALVSSPELLVLDEPTSFLDPLGAERIFKVLGDLNKEHEITVILIEHRMDLAAQYADRVVIFNDGLISHQGTPAEVFMDEKTRRLGVGIPKIVDLYRTLKNDGYHLNSPPMTPKSMAAQLTKLMPETVEIPKKKKHDSNLDDLLGEHMQIPLIEIEDVHFAYSSKVQALDGVSLTIHKGEFIAIMGENGAGKTTLVKHLNGLLRPNSGRILIEGEDIEKRSVATQDIGSTACKKNWFGLPEP